MLDGPRRADIKKEQAVSATNNGVMRLKSARALARLMHKKFCLCMRFAGITIHY